MIISLSPLLYITDSLTSMLVMSFAIHPLSICRLCSLSADKLFRLQRSGVLSYQIERAVGSVN